MLVSCKRSPTYDAILEPLWKRYRLEAPMPDLDEDCYSPGGGSSGCLDPAALGPLLDRSRQPMMDEHEPFSKRLRAQGEFANSQEAAAQEADFRGWAETIVNALHGCPSVEEAAQRCARALTDFSAEVRQAALREAAQSASPGPEPAPDARACDDERVEDGPGSSQSLQHTNKVLMRAVHHLAERCRRLEAANTELPALQQALEQAHEAQRRLTHSNQVLQEHIRISLDARA